MVAVSITIDGKTIAKYEKLPEDVRGALREAIPNLVRQLADRVREKLAPGNLFKTTTHILPAVTAKMIENTSEIYGTVYIDSNKFPDVVAATLESGSVAHIIEAKNAAALFFFWEKLGQNVMFKSVHHPGFEGRSYMQSSLDELQDQLIAGAREAILGPINA
jgi:hypothetical protein